MPPAKKKAVQTWFTVVADMKPDANWVGQMPDQNKVIGLNGCAVEKSFATEAEARKFMASVPGSRIIQTKREIKKGEWPNTLTDVAASVYRGLPGRG